MLIVAGFGLQAYPKTSPIPIPEGLRWFKVANGEPISWCVDVSGLLLPWTEEEVKVEIRAATTKIEMVCGVQFNEVAIPCDIDIFWEPIDGPGSTLAFVFQPSVGVQMSVCPVCADIHWDDAEVLSLTDFHNVTLHELGHSLGLGHLIGGVMNATYSFGTPAFTIDSAMQSELRKRYPVF